MTSKVIVFQKKESILNCMKQVLSDSSHFMLNIHVTNLHNASLWSLLAACERHLH